VSTNDKLQMVGAILRLKIAPDSGGSSPLPHIGIEN